jgi:LacI family transcriptional regulator
MQKPKRVAVLMNLGHVYDRGIIRGVMKYVHSGHPWHLYVEKDPANKIPSFAAWSGDGLIVDLDDGRITKAIPQFKGKLVGIGCLATDAMQKLGISTVKTDDQMIGEWAADHLVDRGLSHFAYCGMRPCALDQWDRVRCDSFRRRVLKHGYQCSVFTGRRHLLQYWDSMMKELTDWLVGLPKPVGLMTCNDSQGLYVLQACRQLGIRVPEDVAIIGVDNDELVCELAVPPLSSVAQDTELIGFRAAQVLDTVMGSSPRRSVHITVPPACLVTRQSSDILAVDDDVITRATKFIREHATELVGVGQIAHHIGVSRSTLEKHFKSLTGRTVHDELQRKRLDIASRLLTCSNLPLQKVAERSGFRSAHYMSSVFRRELGYPPGQLRQQRNGGA